MSRGRGAPRPCSRIPALRDDGEERGPQEYATVATENSIMHHGNSRHRRVGALLAAALVLGVAGGAFAQNAQERRVPLDAHAIQQKADYISNLTTKSISAHTIEQSGGNSGHADLERARSLVDTARADLKAGDLAKAD